MRRFFNVIVSTVLATVLMVGSTVPAMAAEQDVAVSENTIASDDVQNELNSETANDAENRAGDLIGRMSVEADIYPGANIGTTHVGGRAKTIEVTITGITGIVVLKFTNEETGDFRTFDAIGGQTRSLEYVSSMDSGEWNVKVLSSNKKANDCGFTVSFYR